MVSLGRSGGVAFLSFCRSNHPISPQSFTVGNFASRRNFFTTAGLVTTLSLSLPTYSWATSTTTTCDDSSTSLRMTSTNNEAPTLMTGYLNAADAAALDAELMSTPGFSLEQLMELAGLAVAEAVYQVVPPPQQASSSTTVKPRILLVCGPGNNGGDGLVAARHLVMFGYESVVVYPKRSTKTHFVNLVKQCEDVGVKFLDEMPLFPEKGEEGSQKKSYTAIVDAIFGFSFKGTPREPFATALQQMQNAQTTHNIPVLAVDVPSGWDVNEGDIAGTGFVPQVLISLTTPKESSKGFSGRHFVGGRFLPPSMAEKYKVQMPPYPGVSQVMEVTNLSSSSSEKVKVSSSSSPFSSPTGTNKAKMLANKQEEESWEAQYAAYCAEQETELLASAKDEKQNPMKYAEGKGESWEAQYAAYCAEKEARLAEGDARQRELEKEENKIMNT